MGNLKSNMKHTNSTLWSANECEVRAFYTIDDNIVGIPI